VEQTLLDYEANIIHTLNNKGENTGSLLLSVVGGKMSEGINFADHLGRAVIVVGLPYPNLFSVELTEKMKYLNKTSSTTVDGMTKGDVYYENLCIKAVNQSIGRSIRHIRDYSTIILIDKRYEKNNQRIVKKLPKYVQRSYQPGFTFGSSLKALTQFFKEKELHGVDEIKL